ncbi:helix-turn-helix domain-containing protein [Sphingobacterium thalpophilum]|uniref:Helix-turn-helix domain n=2 Tax=Sphingobacterium thalpophilum TaxID=259 RepID=A0A4U9VPI9_9SPHI|nr:Helix-turn-helix domain [Sphingobacterium thalpophilum]
MDLFTNDSDEIVAHQEMIAQLRNRIEQILRNYRPVMNGEIYLSGEDVCKLLHISRRTLQQYRDDQILPYIQIGGKITFKQTDLLRILEQNYVCKWTKEQVTDFEQSYFYIETSLVSLLLENIKILKVFLL